MQRSTETQPLAFHASAANPLSVDLLRSPDMRAAGAQRDVGAIFRLAHEYGGLSLSRLAVLCDMTPSRVGAYAKGRAHARDQKVIERVADGLRIPGAVLGLAARPWEGARGNETGSRAYLRPAAEVATGVDVEVAADGTTSVTYRHTVLNTTDRPLDRLSRRLAFPRGEGTLAIVPIPDASHDVTIEDLHDAGRFATFTCRMTPPIPPLDVAVVAYRCRSPRYVSEGRSAA